MNYITNNWHRWVVAAILACVAMGSITALMNPLAVIAFKTSEPLGLTHIIIAVIFIWSFQQTLWQIVSDMLKIRLGVAWQLGLTGITLSMISVYGAGGKMTALELILLGVTLVFCIGLDNIHTLMGNDDEETAYKELPAEVEKAKNDMALEDDYEEYEGNYGARQRISVH
jgi:hypothetical protein